MEKKIKTKYSNMYSTLLFNTCLRTWGTHYLDQKQKVKSVPLDTQFCTKIIIWLIKKKKDKKGQIA